MPTVGVEADSGRSRGGADLPWRGPREIPQGVASGRFVLMPVGKPAIQENNQFPKYISAL
jgi:hypothetical protein